MKIITKPSLEKLRQQAKIRKSVIWNIEKLNTEMESIRDVRINRCEQDKVMTSNIGDPTSRKAIEIIEEYGDKLSVLHSRLLDLDAQIEGITSEINSCLDKDIITELEYHIIKHYYIDALTIGEIAVILNYSVVWIKQVKAKAVGKISYSG